MGYFLLDDEFVFHFLDTFCMSAQVVLYILDRIHFKHYVFAYRLLDCRFSVCLDLRKLLA